MDVETELICGEAITEMNWLNIQKRHVDLVMFSPPYHGKMTRYAGEKKKPKKMTDREWADWMTGVVRAGE